MTIRLGATLDKLFALASKLGALGYGAYGADINNVKKMTVGAALAAFIHFVDSVWNSPAGKPPSLETAPPTTPPVSP